MANPKGSKNKKHNDELIISTLKDIHIHFQGDVYLLAVWITLSDRAKSTPTCKPQTTLHGLASKFASTYGIDYSNPLSSDDVMKIFRDHGIKGNPCLQLENQDEPNLFDLRKTTGAPIQSQAFILDRIE